MAADFFSKMATPLAAVPKKTKIFAQNFLNFIELYNATM